MSALSESNRITIIEARTLARADSRSEVIDALSLCESPSVVGRTPEELAEVRLSELHSAAFGTLSAIVEELADTLEQLAAEVDKAQAPAPRPSTDVWAVWRVDENRGNAREVGQQYRELAGQTAAQLNSDPRPAGVHFMALPLGGSPWDIPDSARYPQGQGIGSTR